MERTKSVRDAIESWRGGGVRRLLGEIAQRFAGGAQVEAAEPADSRGASFWQEPAQKTAKPRRRREMWMEQGELWRDVVAQPPACEEMEPLSYVPAPLPRRGDGYELQAVLVPARQPRRAPLAQPVSGRRHDIVAKFLQVNDAVQGVHGSGALALPRGRFAARYALWRGAPVGTPFLMGC